MVDREKVINGLECCKPMMTQYGLGACDACPYDRASTPECGICDCLYNLLTDALALLKAQEPSVMKVGEVRNWVNSDRVTREPVFIEMRSGVCAWIIDDEVREIPGAENLTSDSYSKTWRCWTSRPTDEQREAIPWN